jgi:putative hydrolase of the HAD superfamily
VKHYRAVVFDLFGTVALFQQHKLPLFEWEGTTSRSTMGDLQTLIKEKVPTVPFAAFFTALSAVSKELSEVRMREMREFSSAYRFTRVLHRVGLSSSPETDQIATELSLAHMALLAHATEIPRAHVGLLEKAHQHYQIALLSNFDHGPTARQILHRDGASDFFHHIAISEEHGWRKPHPQIFSDTLDAIGVRPHDALFVGDSPYDDIIGARQVGMDIAWVNATQNELPDNIPSPDYVVKDIPELQPILFR